jgi:hypothetical protein
VAPLDEGDAAFVDEPADVTDVDVEGVGDLGDGLETDGRAGSVVIGASLLGIT